MEQMDISQVAGVALDIILVLAIMGMVKVVRLVRGQAVCRPTTKLVAHGPGTVPALTRSSQDPILTKGRYHHPLALQTLHGVGPTQAVMAALARKSH